MKLLREYGIVIVIILVGITGYLFYYQNREDVLSYSLDMLRDRLVEMVDDAAGKEAIAARFNDFKEQVLAQEVAPEEVENIAANVLNMSNSGSSITLEQAEMMIRLASEESGTVLPVPEFPDSAVIVVSADPAEAFAVAVEVAEDAVAATAVAVGGPAPVPPTSDVRRPPSPPQPVEPEEWTALGERLNTMFVFNENMQDMVKGHIELGRDMTQVVRFRVENGLYINVDTTMVGRMEGEAMKEFSKEMKRLEREQMLVWKKNMAREMQAERARARAEALAVESFSERHGDRVQVIKPNLEYLQALKNLEAMGYQGRRVNGDSLRMIVHQQVEKAFAMEQEAREAQQELYEEYWETLSDQIEAQMEAIEKDLKEEFEEEDQ